MRPGKLAFRRQLVVRLLIPIRRDILLVPLAMFSVLGTRLVSVHVRDATTAVTVVGGSGGLEELVVVCC